MHDFPTVMASILESQAEHFSGLLHIPTHASNKGKLVLFSFLHRITEYILQQVTFLQTCGSRSRSACAISPTVFTRTNHLHRRTGIQIGTPKDKSLLENTGVTDCIVFNKTKLVALQRNRGFFFNKKEKGMAMT